MFFHVAEDDWERVYIGRTGSPMPALKPTQDYKYEGKKYKIHSDAPFSFCLIFGNWLLFRLIRPPKSPWEYIMDNQRWDGGKYGGK